MPHLLGRVHRATAEVLAACGVECTVPARHVCCGALHAHNGELEAARRLARDTIRAFDEQRDADGSALPVVVNSAGCGAHMKEYGRLLAEDPEWAERAQGFAGRVVDFTEYLARADRRERLADAQGALGAADGIPSPVTYDDPCHLCHGQGVRAEPRALLDGVRGLTRVELEGAENCCGSAGLYSLLRPGDSSELLDAKLAALRKSGARTLVTANPGCQLQWQAGVARAGLDVQVLHVAEVLAHALARGVTSGPAGGREKSSLG